jgi:hypothetical protein
MGYSIESDFAILHGLSLQAKLIIDMTIRLISSATGIRASVSKACTVFFMFVLLEIIGFIFAFTFHYGCMGYIVSFFAWYPAFLPFISLTSTEKPREPRARSLLLGGNGGVISNL